MGGGIFQPTGSMITSALKPLRILLVAAFGTGLSSALPAQVTTVAPLLTASPDAAPITTLSIDLLAPQRPFIFDPTGSSLLANAMDPSIYASTLNSAAAETDLQLRDSSQTGRVSPFAAGTTRLGLSFSGGDGPASAVASGRSTGASLGSSIGASASQGSGTEMNSASLSSWGTNSSFGDQSTSSTWGTKALRVERLGRSQPESPVGGSSLNGENSTDANSAESQPGLPSLTKRKRPGTVDIAGQRQRSHSEVNEEGTSDRNGKRTSGGNGETTAPDTNALVFSAAPSAEHAFGDSPFYPPGGNGDLTFLTPNIFAATSMRPSSRSTRASSAKEDNLQRGFERSSTLATSATHYGLAPHPGVGRSMTGMSDKLSVKKRPRLSGTLLDSVSP
jgi:hypothetical protein